MFNTAPLPLCLPETGLGKQGAPSPNKTTHFSGSVLLVCDDGFEAGLVVDDLDLLVVDADFGDHGAALGLVCRTTARSTIRSGSVDLEFA